MNRFIELQKELEAHRRQTQKMKKPKAKASSIGHFGHGFMSESEPKQDTPRKKALLVFIENTGALPFTWPSAIPSYIQKAVEELVDYVAEEFEKMLNDFKGSQGKEYDKVVQLEDSTATKAQLSSNLLDLTNKGYQIDVITIGHGGTDVLIGYGGSRITNTDIQAIKTANGGKKLPIRMVYMMNCKGSSLNDDWLAIGAKVSGGSVRNNYMPEPMMHLFWKKWKAGMSYEKAQNEAWAESRNLINGAISAVVGGGSGIASFFIPGGIIAGYIAGKYAANELKSYLKGFIDDSKPVIAGNGACTIYDALPVTLSFAHGRQHGQFAQARRKRHRPAPRTRKKHGYFVV